MPIDSLPDTARDRIIDTDSHVVEAADIWTARMPTRWGSDIPHVKWVAEQNSEVWFVAEHPVMPVGFSVISKDATGGVLRREEDFPAFLTTFDSMHPSSFDPTERAKVMDDYGIEAAVLYPNLTFVGPDIYRALPNSPLEYQLDIARAYNDWVLWWEQEQPGRFIPMACLPYWDVPSAVSEIERCSELGHRGFVMTGTPELHGEPMLASPHWEPMWAAAEASGLPISFHAGGGGPGHMETFAARAEVSGRYAALVLNTATDFLRNAASTCDLLMSGILPRHPGLRFAIVETGVGWIPFVLETLDKHFAQYRVWRDKPEFTELPSFYFSRQVFANAWFEKLTPELVARIGADRLLFETDYPHPTCLIADEISGAITNGMGELAASDRRKILSQNAAELYGLPLTA